MVEVIRQFGPIENGGDTVHLAPPKRAAFCKPLTREEITTVLGELDVPGFGAQVTAKLLAAGVPSGALCVHCFTREYRKIYRHHPATAT